MRMGVILKLNKEIEGEIMANVNTSVTATKPKGSAELKYDWIKLYEEGFFANGKLEIAEKLIQDVKDRKEFLGTLGQRLAATCSSAQRASESGDAVTTDEEKKKIAEDQRRIGTIVQELMLAEYRLKHGQFGICDECGEYIHAKRLKAKPSAIFCLDCQEKKEINK